MRRFRCRSLTAIEDQVFGRRVVRECLAQLLNDPGARRISCHIEMKDVPPVVGDDEEAVENAEGERRTVKKSIAAMTSR